jgi:putative DNA primase/helicase
MVEKTLPVNMDVERAALGSLLRAESFNVKWSFDEFREVVAVESFFNPDHRKICAAIYSAIDDGDPIDPHSLFRRLPGEPEVGTWMQLLLKIADEICDPCNALHYGGRVAECWRRREAIRRADDLANRLCDPNFELSQIAEVGAELAAMAGPGGKKKARRASFRVASEVVVKPVNWLWRDRIPAGMLSIFTGLPDCGKSSVCIDMAARLSNGTGWPDRRYEPNPVGDTIYITGEDSVDRVLVPRLMAAGADLERVVFFDGVDTDKGDDCIRLDLDIPTIASMLDERPYTRLIVLDPLVSFLGRADSHKDSEIRQVLSPLAKMADERGVAIVAIIHFKKAGDVAAINKVSGSRGFTGAARTVWGFVRENAEHGHDISKMLHIKSNIGPRSKGLAFELGHKVEVFRDDQVEHPSDRYAPCIQWRDGEIEDDINDLLDQERTGQDRGERDDAADWLRECLADGRWPAKDIKRMASESGHSWATIRRAKDEVGARATRDGFGSSGIWYWEMPVVKDAHIDAHIDAQQEKVSAYGEGEHLWDSSEIEGVEGGRIGTIDAHPSIDAHLSVSEHLSDTVTTYDHSLSNGKQNGKHDLKSVEAFKR